MPRVQNNNGSYAKIHELGRISVRVVTTDLPDPNNPRNWTNALENVVLQEAHSDLVERKEFWLGSKWPNNSNLELIFVAYI